MTSQNPALTQRIAAICGFLGVALGAFGAHGLHATLAANNAVAIWEKAVLYHLVHATVLLALSFATRPISAWIPRLFVAGIAIFSGSLYVLSLTGIKKLGAITPIGGVCFLVGWGLLVCRGGCER